MKRKEQTEKPLPFSLLDWIHTPNRQGNKQQATGQQGDRVKVGSADRIINPPTSTLVNHPMDYRMYPQLRWSLLTEREREREREEHQTERER